MVFCVVPCGLVADENTANASEAGESVGLGNQSNRRLLCFPLSAPWDSRLEAHTTSLPLPCLSVSVCWASDLGGQRRAGWTRRGAGASRGSTAYSRPPASRSLYVHSPYVPSPSPVLCTSLPNLTPSRGQTHSSRDLSCQTDLVLGLSHTHLVQTPPLQALPNQRSVSTNISLSVLMPLLLPHHRW